MGNPGCSFEEIIDDHLLGFVSEAGLRRGIQAQDRQVGSGRHFKT